MFLYKGNQSTTTWKHSNPPETHSAARIPRNKPADGHMREKRVLRRGTRLSSLCKTVLTRIP